MQRTLAVLKAETSLLSYRKVEHWNHYAKKRQDLYGGDVLALYPMAMLLIQVTHMTDRAGHVKDALESQEVLDWLTAGGDFEVWAWRKLKDVGWQHDITVFRASMIHP